MRVVQRFENIYVLLLIIGLSVFGSPGHAAEWKVGLGKARITPAEPIRMGGYAARNRPSDQDGNLTELWVKAIVFFDAEGKRSLLVCADIIRFPKFVSDEIRNELLRKYGLSKEQIILNGSHTHSGPELDPAQIRYMATQKELEVVEKYTGTFIKQTLAAVDAAFSNSFEATIHSGSGVTRFAVNRRNNKESDIASLSELKGPADHSVPVLKIVDKKEKVRAILFGYACHPTVLSDYQISGDYPAFAQMSLEEKFPEAQAMFFIGAAADQNPLPRRKVQLAIQYGEELSSAVQAVLAGPMKPLQPELGFSYQEIALRYEQAVPGLKELEAIRDDTVRNPNWIVNKAKVLIDQINSGQPVPASYPFPVQVWTIGDQTLVTLGGEIVVEYSWKIKELLGPQTIIIGYSNDLMSYIPSQVVLREGGYEGSRSSLFTNPWHADIEDSILQEVRRQALKLGLKVK